jgi:phosphatidylethanolamine/phosphatidyl-N-methylethanolamine N-methyltransferase
MKLLKQRMLFLSQSLLKPRETGAISPSSTYLAAAMAKEISLQNQGYVLELGGGTGSLTRGLLAHGIDPKKLIIIEKNPIMVKELKHKFPECQIEAADAQDLSFLRHDIEMNASTAPPTIESIISGLPLRSLPKNIGHAILTSAFSLLPNHGKFIQFTYGMRSPVPEDLLLKHDMQTIKKKWILKNFPPATVWVYQKEVATAHPPIFRSKKIHDYNAMQAPDSIDTEETTDLIS